MTIYKQNIPQATDIISVSQADLLNNFSYLDTFLNTEHIQSGRDTSSSGSGRHRTVSMPNQATATIASITPSASPTTFTTTGPHGFSTGDSVYISGITSYFTPSPSVALHFNNKSAVITVTGASTFTVATDTTGYTYTSGGTVSLNPAIPTGTNGIMYVANGELLYRGTSGVINVSGGASTISSNAYVFFPGQVIMQYGTVTAAGSSGSVTFPTIFATGAPLSIQLTLKRSSATQTATVDSGTPPTSSGFNYLCSSGGSDLYWMAIGL